MINKKLLTSTAIASLMISSVAFAQTNKFAGPSIAISASQVAAETHVNSYTDSNAYDTVSDFFQEGSNKNAQSSRVGGLDLNYGIAISNNFVLGIGATYDFGKIKSGKQVNATFSEDNYESVSNEIISSLKSHRSVYIQPTYVVNKDSAIFAKIGRHYAKSNTNMTYCQSSSDGYVGDCVDGTEENLSTNKTVSGWGYGLGLKMFVTDNLFVQAEGSVVNYGRHTSDSDDYSGYDAYLYNDAKTKTSNATISVGYKF